MVYLKIEGGALYALNGSLDYEQTDFSSVGTPTEWQTDLVLTYPCGEKVILFTVDDTSLADEILCDICEEIEKGKHFIKICSDIDYDTNGGHDVYWVKKT